MIIHLLRSKNSRLTTLHDDLGLKFYKRKLYKTLVKGFN